MRAFVARPLGRTMLILVLLATVGLVSWRTYFRHQWPKNWGEVVPGKIYRSGQNSSYCIEQVLTEHKIQRVIFMSVDESDTNHTERNVCAKMGIERFNLPLGGDGLGSIRRYADAITLMIEAEKQGRPVLVHCEAGAQRTGGVVAAYRILVQGWSVEEAYEEMRRFGHDPEDNPRLIPYLNAKMPVLAQLLKERGTLPISPNSAETPSPLVTSEATN